MLLQRPQTHLLSIAVHLAHQPRPDFERAQFSAARARRWRGAFFCKAIGAYSVAVRGRRATKGPRRAAHGGSAATLAGTCEAQLDAAREPKISP